MIHGATTTRDLSRRPPCAASIRRLLAEVVREGEAAEASLWTLTADRARLECALNHGPTADALEAVTVPASGSVVGVVFSTGQALSAGPEEAYDRTADRATGTRTEAMMAAPVTVEGRTVGVLSAINPRRPTASGTFSSEALELLVWKAGLVGSVLGAAARS